MVTTLKRPIASKLTLQADTAAEMMSPNPISISHNAEVSEALNLMTDRAFTVAPVIDASGRAVGVVSITDILIHNRENSEALNVVAEISTADPVLEGADVAIIDRTTVKEIMTPAVFAVRPETPASEVVRMLLAHCVHHLFVSDNDGVLVGVISAGDILRHLAK